MEIYVLSSYIPLYGNILLLIYNTDLILIGVWLLGMGNFLLKICTDLENIMLSEISSPVFAPGEYWFTSNWRVELEVSQVRFHYSATGVFCGCCEISKNVFFCSENIWVIAFAVLRLDRNFTELKNSTQLILTFKITITRQCRFLWKIAIYLLVEPWLIMSLST